MNEAPRVSVIVPFLDPEPGFLAQAIESVFEQDFGAWELLLVNDGSGPLATEEARRWERKAPERVRILAHRNNVNRGVPATRNRGIEEARGEFVAFLDADDLWLPGRLAAHVALLDAHPGAGMAYGPTLYWRSWQDERSPDFCPSLGVPAGRLFAPGSLLVHLITGEVAVPCPTSTTCRTAAVREVGGFVDDFRWPTEDQAFYVKMLLGASTVTTDEVLDRYRQHADSATGSRIPEKEAEWRRPFLDWVLAYVRENGVRDARLERALRIESWALDHPRGARLLRIARQLRRHLRLGRPVAGRPPSGAGPSEEPSGSRQGR